MSSNGPLIGTSVARLTLFGCLVGLLLSACGVPASDPLEEPVGPPASPSLVEIGALDPASPSVEPICVGSVVGDGRILTAAHCVLGADGRLVRPLVRLSEPWRRSKAPDVICIEDVDVNPPFWPKR